MQTTPIPSSEETSGYQLLATKTYFTTSTYFTTYIDKSRTVTKTRSSVRSRVVTETYSGGQFDYLPSPPVQSTVAPLIDQSPEEKYLSFGPNIYGLVKTYYATYTYYTTNQLGLSDESREVITQVSTSIFSTTDLPASISVATLVPEIQPSASLQLDKDSLLSIKQSFIAGQFSDSPSLTASYVQLSENGPAVQQTVLSSFDRPELSIDEQLDITPATIGFTSVLQSVAPVNVINVPDTQIPITRPTDRPAPSSQEDVADSEKNNDNLAETEVSDTTIESSEDESGISSAFTTGLLGAVVGGLSNALIPKPQNTGGNVDLGPVLDAVATLLRGPIRSAIANRRNTASADDRTYEEELVSPTPVLNIPKFARVPQTQPNFIPVGEAANSRYIQSSRGPDHGFIPLGGQQTYSNQILPRIDTSLEIEADGNHINYAQASGNHNPKDSDLIVHNNDPHIIDVLNKYEHSYLYNKHVNDPLRIKISQGEKSAKKQNYQNSQKNPSPVYKQPKPTKPGQRKYPAQANNPNQRAPNQPRRPSNPPPPRREGSKQNTPGRSPYASPRPKNANQPPPRPSNNPYSAARPNKNSPPRPLQRPPPPTNPTRHSGYPRPKVVKRPPIPPPSPPPPSYETPYSSPIVRNKEHSSNPNGDYKKSREPLPNNSANTGATDNRPQQQQYGSGTPSIKQQQQQYVSGTPGSKQQQQQYGSGSPNNKPQQQQYGSGNPDNRQKPQQYGSGTPDIRQQQQQKYKSGTPDEKQQQQYGSETPDIKQQQQQYGSVSPNNNPQQQQYGSGNPDNRQKQQQYGSGTPDIRQQQQFKSGTPDNRQQQQQYGSGTPVIKQQQYGTGTPDNRQQQQQYGSETPDIKQQQQYGTGTPGIREQQKQYGSGYPNNKPQQQQNGSGTRRKNTPQSEREPQSGVVTSNNQGQQGGSSGGNYINNGQTPSQYGGTYPSNKNPSNSAKKSTFNYKPKSNSGQAPTAGYGQSTTPSSIRGENNLNGSKNIGVSTSAKRLTTRFQYQSTTPSSYGRDTYRVSLTTPRYNGNRPSDKKVRRPYNDLGKGRRPTTRFIPRPTPPSWGVNNQNKKNSRPNEVQIDEPTYGINSNGAKDVQDITIVDDTVKYASPAGNPAQSNEQDVKTQSGYSNQRETEPYESDTILLGELQPSFTVTANFPITSQSVGNSRFTIAKSKNKYDYQGWLTDGDPLKDLPPLRPTTTLDITAVQTEAPKTVTYQNEWQTPIVLPTLSFVPQSPPPPLSNFESEWTAYQKGENTKADVLKPTKTLQISVRQTDAPKTVTYANEWFARKDEIQPSQTKVYSNYQYVSETRRPGLGNARIDVVDPYDDIRKPYTSVSKPGSSADSSDQTGSSDNSPLSVADQIYKNTSPRPVIRIDSKETDADNAGISFVTPGQYNRRRRPTNVPAYGTPTPSINYSPTSRSSIRRPAPPSYRRPQGSSPTDSSIGDSVFSGSSNPSYASTGVNPTYPSLQDSTEPIKIKLEYKSPVRPGYQSTLDIDAQTDTKYDDQANSNSVSSSYQGSVYPAVPDPTNPTYPADSTRIRKPQLDPSGPGSNKVTYFGTNTTPEIINGNVRIPPRPPATGLSSVENQSPDSYQDNYPLNKNQGRVSTTGSPPKSNYVTGYSPDNVAGQNNENEINAITVTSDGYKGYKNVDNVPTSTYRNNYIDVDTTEPTFVDNTGIETISDGYNGFIERVTERPNQGREPVERNEEDNVIRKPEYPSIKSGEGGFGSLGHQYLDELVGGNSNGKKKRKYDKTVTREQNIVTSGKPTFINIDQTYATKGYDATNPPTTARSTPAIVTEPSKTPPSRIIRPQKSSDTVQENPGNSRSSSLTKPFDYTRYVGS